MCVVTCQHVICNRILLAGAPGEQTGSDTSCQSRCHADRHHKAALTIRALQA